MVNWEIKIVIPPCDLQPSDFSGNVATSKRFMYSAVSNLHDCSVCFTPLQIYPFEHHLGFSEKISATLQLMHNLFITTKDPQLSIDKYSFIKPSDLEQCRVTKLAHGIV